MLLKTTIRNLLLTRNHQQKINFLPLYAIMSDFLCTFAAKMAVSQQDEDIRIAEH
jgi:hypothetical protein